MVFSPKLRDYNAKFTMLILTDKEYENFLILKSRKHLFFREIFRLLKP